MIHAWGITDKGAVRTQNQDGYYLDVPSEHLAVGVVCDGMGGAKAGNVASLVAVETFVDALKEMGSQEESRPAAVLAQAAGTANSAVFHRAATHPDCRCRGYAGTLLRHAIQETRARGKAGLVLTCKEKLVPYYARFGFVSEGPSASQHGGAAWYQMRLRV